MNKSNITITSNIYPINENIIGKDKQFLSHVEGKGALEILNKKTSYTKNNAFTKVQLDQWEYGMKCFYNKDEDLTWGLIKVNGSYNMKCRCTLTTCKHFKGCRPDFNTRELEHVIETFVIEEEPKLKDMESMKAIEVPSILLSNSQHKHIQENKIVEETTIKVEKSIEKIHVKEIWQSFNTIDNIEVNEVRDEEEIKGSIVDQKYVIEASPESKILVNAGPGTGKTYTLIERLKFLTDSCDINSADEMMVLCFSRAAVVEVKKRIKKAIESNEVSDDLRFLDIRTFDSFATYLLYEINEEEDLTGVDYADRIKASIKTIKENRQIFSGFKHFIVDEIQDLVGERALLVQEILKSLECGFTLLGDSCQAIYDYQIKEDDGINSKKFYKWLEDNYEENIDILEFLGNHRQTDTLDKLASKIRGSIQNNSSYESKVSALKNSIEDIDGVGDILSVIKQLDNIQGTTCFLCRNNGEVQKVSQYLRNSNIKHSVQKSAKKRVLEPWIGRVLGTYEHETIDYNEFKDEMIKYNLSMNSDIQSKWKLLELISQSSSSRIKIRDLITNLVKDVSLSNDLCIDDKSKIVVSTIHRSKGREYDRVILLEDSILYLCEQDNNLLIDELKTFYVSITRPKKELLMTKFRRKSYLKQIKNSDGRWAESSKLKNKKYKAIAFLEIGKERDIDELSFISLTNFRKEQFVFDNQKYINESITKGDELVLRRFISFDGKEKYQIKHNDKIIGIMSDNFSYQLKAAINQVQGFCYDIPLEIQQVYVDEIITHTAKEIKEDVPKIFNKTRLWNGISISGFGIIKWKESDL